MQADQLKLQQGSWVVANCGKFKTEKNCQLVMMAPESQRNELLEVMVDHASKKHGHQNNPELRKQLDKMIENVNVK